MAAWILFDTLLVAMLLLVIPIGFWRGGVREALVGGSILAGAGLARAYAVSWGENASDILGIRSSSAFIVVALTLLWGTVIVLGYGGGAVSQLPDRTLVNCLAGAILSLFNGLLLLSVSLSFIDQAAALREGYIARVLVAGADAILLLAVIVFSVGNIAGLIARLAGGWSQNDDVVIPDTAISHRWPAVPPTPRTFHSARGAEEGKFESGRRSTEDAGQGHELGGRSTAWLQTAPDLPRLIQSEDRRMPNISDVQVPPVSDSQPAPSREAETASDESVSGIQVVEEWLRRAPTSKRFEKKQRRDGQNPRPMSRDDDIDS